MMYNLNRLLKNAHLLCCALQASPAFAGAGYIDVLLCTLSPAGGGAGGGSLSFCALHLDIPDQVRDKLLNNLPKIGFFNNLLIE
ncbi:MAG: hypothetical protein CSYNP_02706 [Syntrophus sp. SKADARSKE-3]|nr:hypothetical protein [Syntrophus sp. SKADARSKE-3]